jgi:hypothetical protein
MQAIASWFNERLWAFARFTNFACKDLGTFFKVIVGM